MVLEPEYLPNTTVSPTFTSTGITLPSLVTRPVPTATTSPWFGFSAAEPGNKIPPAVRSEEHTSELQSRPHLVCRLLLEKKKKAEHDGTGLIRRPRRPRRPRHQAARRPAVVGRRRPRQPGRHRDGVGLGRPRAGALLRGGRRGVAVRHCPRRRPIWRRAQVRQTAGRAGPRRRDAGSHRRAVFFFNDPATTEIYTLSLHDALPI